MLHATPTKLDAAPNEPSGNGERLRVLLNAFSCHPKESMESRLAWRRVALASHRHDVTVLTGSAYSVETLSELARQEGFSDRVDFHTLEPTLSESARFNSNWLYYSGYSSWQRRALVYAKQLHAANRFDLVHQVNYCGYREPGLLWKLGLPYVWGPVGGTHHFPWRMLPLAGASGAIREVTRNVVNGWQLRFASRVRGASRASSVVVAATKRAQADLARVRGIKSEIELETGLDCPIGPAREPRADGRPFRILWAGRLQPWKAFPILARAVARLPDSFPVRVRVLGSGPSSKAWRRLTKRLGLAARFEFIEWPSYEATHQHYRWADAYAFTSLRDTSGTGLIEALAAGTPIIGVDHQGAADIMTDACAIRVPVESPRQAYRDFAAGISELAADPVRWLAMSHAAQKRANEYRWEFREEATHGRYRRAIASHRVEAVKSSNERVKNPSQLFPAPPSTA